MRRCFYWRWFLLLKWWWRQVLDLILLIFFFNHLPSIAPVSRVVAWWFGGWDLCPELLPGDLGLGPLSRVVAWWFGDWDLCPELLPGDLGAGTFVQSCCLVIWELGPLSRVVAWWFGDWIPTSFPVLFLQNSEGMAAQSVSLSLGTKVLASISRAMWGQSNRSCYCLLF